MPLPRNSQRHAQRLVQIDRGAVANDTPALARADHRARACLPGAHVRQPVRIAPACRRSSRHSRSRRASSPGRARAWHRWNSHRNTGGPAHRGRIARRRSGAALLVGPPAAQGASRHLAPDRVFRNLLFQRRLGAADADRALQARAVEDRHAPVAVDQLEMDELANFAQRFVIEPGNWLVGSLKFKAVTAFASAMSGDISAAPSMPIRCTSGRTRRLRRARPARRAPSPWRCRGRYRKCFVKLMTRPRAARDRAPAPHGR